MFSGKLASAKMQDAYADDTSTLGSRSAANNTSSYSAQANSSMIINAASAGSGGGKPLLGEESFADKVLT